MQLKTALRSLRAGARDAAPVAGLTHQHYKYPARFSPSFARAAIEAFSHPGDLVLDPYMGGGTTVVEALAAKRLGVGCDINSLAVFVAGVKSRRLSEREAAEVERWLLTALDFSYRDDAARAERFICPDRTKNLHLPRARPLKKFIAHCLASCETLRSDNTKSFVRCVLLNVTQWALNGRRKPATLQDFRDRLAERAFEMLEANAALPGDTCGPTLIHESAANLATIEPFASGRRADLIVTSPPYPGIHVLYHRWQVDGRKETPAPYWIANCTDGQGGSYYNFGSRKQQLFDGYFESSLRTLKAIRSSSKLGAFMVQMIAFSDARSQLPRYLRNMEEAGFVEVPTAALGMKRIWRQVPRRTWHADLQGETGGAKEVVLVHVAV